MLQFPLSFLLAQGQNLVLLMVFLFSLIRIFVNITSEMYGRRFLIQIPLQHFLSGFWLGLMHISSSKVSGQASLICMVFMCVCVCVCVCVCARVFLPLLGEIMFFICTNKIILLCLRSVSGRLVLVAKEFLNLLNLLK